MANELIPMSTLVVDLVATAAIALDGTETTVDSVSVADEMLIYPAANVASSERAVYYTGADHTQPWVKVSNAMIGYTGKVISIYAKSGTVYGGNTLTITNVATGAIASSTASNATLTGTQTLTNKTLTAPTIAGATVTGTVTATSATANIGTVSATTTLGVASTGKLQVAAAAGALARIGSAVLVAGTVTVANTVVSADTQIYLSVSTVGGTVGSLSYTKINGTSFTINSSSNLETSTVDWFFVEKA